jgi:hypothetical protein
MNTDEQIAKLEAISDPNKNEIRMNRDRVGNWRVIIDEHFTDLYVDGRNKSLALAIHEALTNYHNYERTNR